MLKKCVSHGLEKVVSLEVKRMVSNTSSTNSLGKSLQLSESYFFFQKCSLHYVLPWIVEKTPLRKEHQVLRLCYFTPNSHEIGIALDEKNAAWKG